MYLRDTLKMIMCLTDNHKNDKFSLDNKQGGIK